MDGSATLTAVASSWAMNRPKQQASNASRVRNPGSAGAPAAPWRPSVTGTLADAGAERARRDINGRSARDRDTHSACVPPVQKSKI